jgi:ribosomal protein L44E
MEEMEADYKEMLMFLNLGHDWDSEKLEVSIKRMVDARVEKELVRRRLRPPVTPTSPSSLGRGQMNESSIVANSQATMLESSDSSPAKSHRRTSSRLRESPGIAGPEPNRPRRHSNVNFRCALCGTSEEFLYIRMTETPEVLNLRCSKCRSTSCRTSEYQAVSRIDLSRHEILHLASESNPPQPSEDELTHDDDETQLPDGKVVGPWGEIRNAESLDSNGNSQDY